MGEPISISHFITEAGFLNPGEGIASGPGGRGGYDGGGHESVEVDEGPV